MAVAKIQKEVDVDAVESPTAVETKDVSGVEDCTWAKVLLTGDMGGVDAVVLLSW